VTTRPGALRTRLQGQTDDSPHPSDCVTTYRSPSSDNDFTITKRVDHFHGIAMPLSRRLTVRPDIGGNRTSWVTEASHKCAVDPAGEEPGVRRYRRCRDNECARLSSTQYRAMFLPHMALAIRHRCSVPG
jgi:hypothetical protein